MDCKNGAWVEVDDFFHKHIPDLRCKPLRSSSSINSLPSVLASSLLYSLTLLNKHGNGGERVGEEYETKVGSSKK